MFILLYHVIYGILVHHFLKSLTCIVFFRVACGPRMSIMKELPMVAIAIGD